MNECKGLNEAQLRKGVNKCKELNKWMQGFKCVQGNE